MTSGHPTLPHMVTEQVRRGLTAHEAEVGYAEFDLASAIDHLVKLVGRDEAKRRLAAIVEEDLR